MQQASPDCPRTYPERKDGGQVMDFAEFVILSATSGGRGCFHAISHSLPIREEAVTIQRPKSVHLLAEIPPFPLQIRDSTIRNFHIQYPPAPTQKP